MFRQWLEKQDGYFQLTWTNIEFIFQISRLFVGLCVVWDRVWHFQIPISGSSEKSMIYFWSHIKLTPKRKLFFFLSLAAKKLAFSIQQSAEKLSYKVNDLISTENRESCEKSQSPTNETKLSLHSDLDVLVNLVVRGRVKVDLKYLQIGSSDNWCWKET